MWIDNRGSEILPRNECLRLVAVAANDRAIGRLGVAVGPSPIIVPVNFAYRDSAVLVRLGSGTVAQSAAGNLVSFEVDRVDDGASQGWSVLIRGLARVVGDEDLGGQRGGLPQPLVPSPGDLVLSIRGDVVTGRRFSIGRRPGRDVSSDRPST
jgi:hypothetical protein